MSATSTTSASSAAPAEATPAQPVAPVSPAPVAAASEPSTLNDYAALALKSLSEDPASPAAEPAAPVNEPSPEATAEAPAEPTSEEIDSPLEAEQPADDMANWTEGEKKLHGALVKERQANKEIRAELREMREALAKLQSQPAKPATEAEPQSPAEPAPSAPSAPALLQDCHTFEQVDAKAAQAAQTEAQAMRLQNILNRNGVEPVIERLKAGGVDAINGTPIAEASADQIGDFLAAVYEGAKLTQAEAPQRKTWLTQNQQSLMQAVQIVPELNDAKSEAFKAAQRLVQQNPLLRNRADWPVVVAKLYLGEQAFNQKAQPKTAPKAAPAKPVLKPAPSAPRTSTAALPQASSVDTIRQRIANGTATLAEVQSLTLGGIQA